MCDMKSDPFFDSMSRRDQQKLRTAARILATAVTLVAEAGQEAVTIRAVAARAGVTERTVFRHFRSKQGLFKAVSQVTSFRMKPSPPPRTPAELVERPRSEFRILEQERDLVRAYLNSQSLAKGPRRRVDKERTEAMIQCVQRNLEYMDRRKLRRRAAIADLLASPYALEWMRQFWGFSGKQAGEAAAEAIDILVNFALSY